MTSGISGSNPNPEGGEGMSLGLEGSEERVSVEELFGIKPLIEPIARDTPLDKARYRIAMGLFIVLTAVIGLTTLRLLCSSNPLSDQSLDFIKWSVGLLGSLFGTAMGFYFGGKR